MPELFMTMFPKSKDGYMINILKWIEGRCFSFADVVITPNISFRETFISRGCPLEKISIVMNSPDENIFKVSKNLSSKSKSESFVIMCHGTILKRSRMDILVEAVSQVYLNIPNLKLLIYGDGEFLDYVKLKVKELNLSGIVDMKGSVIVDKIAEAINEIDLGVIPNRSNLFTQINFPVRIFEYMVMKKPVIVPKTKGILDYFKEDSIFFFNAGDPQSLARAIIIVYENPDNTKRVLEKSAEVFNRYRWESQKQRLIDLVSN